MELKFFLRDGTQVERPVWASKQSDAAYLRVADEHLPNGTWVSTVWTGVDRDGAGGIFETAVFEESTRRSLEQRKYSTEREAIEGHGEIVARWRALKR